MSTTINPAAMSGLFDCEFFDLPAKALDETFRIFVAKPPVLEPGKRYPVIYALDGNGLFGTVAEAARMMAMGNEIPPAFIVGIGYAVDNGFAGTMAKRYRDYTPTRGGEPEAAIKTQFDPSGEIEPGGGPTFLKFLTEELKPAIENHYPVDANDATIGGGSLGGLFPTWVLITAPQSFQRYIIISPSIWWNGEEVWEWEKQHANKTQDISATIFVTAGGLETADAIQAQIEMATATDGPMKEMMEDMRASYDKHGWPKMAEITPTLAARLNARGHAGMSVHCHNLPDETHMSVGPGAFSRGLRYVFGHWQP